MTVVFVAFAAKVMVSNAWHNSCLTAAMMTIERASIQEKYRQLISAAESSGVQLHVRELNNILYIDGQVPSEEVKEQLWDLYHQIDPEFRSGDLVLSLHTNAA